MLMNAHASFKRIDCKKAQAIIARVDLIILDARDAAIFARGHIDRAVNLLVNNICDFAESTEKSRPLLIYCQRGNESLDYSKFLAELGFLEVYSLDGGYDAWTRSNAAQLDAARGRSMSENEETSEDASSVPFNGLTLLMKAAYEGNAELIKRLIAAGADPNVRNGDGNNALWLACAGDKLEAARLLVAVGINMDNQNDTGATALIYAASAGKAALVELLLGLGANPGLETLDGFSALDLASTFECLALLRGKARTGGEPIASVRRNSVDLQTGDATRP
jgi:rhodanese-related sulfurtransferase